MNMYSRLRGWLISPSAIVALCICVTLFTVFQFSLRAFIPGSLDVGGFTLANFTGMDKSLYRDALRNTLVLSIETTVFSLLLAYPLAYALVRVRNRALKSVILITAITPLFLGEIVRTYAWIIALGSTGFINSMLRKVGVIEQPIELMFTHFGVLVALVHVTIPVVVLMLSAAIAHIDRDYEKAAQSLGAGPYPHFPYGDAAAFHARHSCRFGHGFRVDIQCLRHATDDRRRARPDHLDAHLSTGFFVDGFPSGGKPERRRPRADHGVAVGPSAN